MFLPAYHAYMKYYKVYLPDVRQDLLYDVKKKKFATNCDELCPTCPLQPYAATIFSPVSDFMGKKHRHDKYQQAKVKLFHNYIKNLLNNFLNTRFIIFTCYRIWRKIRRTRCLKSLSRLAVNPHQIRGKNPMVFTVFQIRVDPYSNRRLDPVPARDIEL